MKWGLEIHHVRCDQVLFDFKFFLIHLKVFKLEQYRGSYIRVCPLYLTSTLKQIRQKSYIAKRNEDFSWNGLIWHNILWGRLMTFLGYFCHQAQLLLKEKMTLECRLVEETITGEVFSNSDQKEIGFYLVQFQHLISCYECQILVVWYDSYPINQY